MIFQHGIRVSGLADDPVLSAWQNTFPPTSGDMSDSDDQRVGAEVRPKRILIVEDDRAVVETLGGLLEEEGYEILRASDGREALDRLQGDVAPDLILLDLRMPVMDGWTFRNAQKRVSHLAPIPVVAMSADATSRAQAISADAFLRKPLDLDDLLATIRRVLADDDARRRSDHWRTVERMASLGRIAAGVGHEINNPLAFVLMNVTLASERLQRMASSGDSARALREETAVAEVRELADMLNDSLIGLERIRGIVRNLQSLSQRVDDKHEVVNLEKVIDESIVVAWNHIQHRARLSKRYGELPVVKGSPAALGQVFLNLLVNAAQAIPAGNAFGNVITIVTASDGQGVTVDIADTGAGIAPDVLPRIFDPFFTTKPVDEGTGLGLSICQRIVTDHGGRLTIESELGRGSVCRLWLPAAREIEIPAARPEPPPPPPSLAPSGRRARILVIDDELKIGEVIAQVLSRRHEVITFQEAQRALDLLDGGQTFDVVLCDVMMPNIGGQEVFEAFARWPAMLPALIFMTGGTFSEDAQAFLRRAQRPVLYKPFTASELEAMVDARLNAESLPSKT
jgi:signal transduction histidine kinase